MVLFVVTGRIDDVRSQTVQDLQSGEELESGKRQAAKVADRVESGSRLDDAAT